MSSLIDIITATFIGAIVILMIIGINFYIQNSASEVNNANIAQMNLREVAELLDYDLYKIGFRVPTSKIILADSTRITFRTDINNDGTIDTVRYYTGNPSALTSTRNPNDRILYRLINSEPERGANLGVVSFRLTYFDSTNTVINYLTLQNQTGRDRIKTIEYYVRVESLFPVEGYYQGAEIKKVIRPRNL